MTPDQDAARRAEKSQCPVLIRFGSEWTYNCIREEGHDPELWHNFHIDDEGVDALTLKAPALAEARRAAELVDQWIAGGGMIYDLPSLIATALAEARRAERERCAARVREAYDGVCE